MSAQPATVSGPISDARARILCAAQERFAHSGYNGTSISQIADAAGVSKANVFHHFKSKQDLYMEVLHDSRAHLEGLFDEFKSAGDLLQHLQHFLDGYLDSIYSREPGFRLVLHEMLAGHQHEAIANRVGGDNFRRLVSNLRTAQQRGELRAGIDPAVTAFVLIAVSAFFYQSRPVLEHIPEAGFAHRPEDYLKQVAELIAFGIAPAGEQ